MKGHIKAIDYTKHGVGGGNLTDSNIDRYVLQGFYGPERRATLLHRIEALPYDKPKIVEECLEGKFGPDALRAAKLRSGRKIKRNTKSRKLTTNELLKEFGL